MKIVAGIYLMAIEWEEKAPEIIAATGLLPPGLPRRPEDIRAGKSRGLIEKTTPAPRFVA